MPDKDAATAYSQSEFLKKMSLRDADFERDLQAANKPFGPGQVMFAVALGLLLLGVSGGAGFLLSTLTH